jgi:hypothetical protein
MCTIRRMTVQASAGIAVVHMHVPAYELCHGGAGGGGLSPTHKSRDS